VNRKWFGPGNAKRLIVWLEAATVPVSLQVVLGCQQGSCVFNDVTSGTNVIAVPQVESQIAMSRNFLRSLRYSIGFSAGSGTIWLPARLSKCGELGQRNWPSTTPTRRPMSASRQIQQAFDIAAGGKKSVLPTITLTGMDGCRHSETSGAAFLRTANDPAHCYDNQSWRCSSQSQASVFALRFDDRGYEPVGSSTQPIQNRPDCYLAIFAASLH